MMHIVLDLITAAVVVLTVWTAASRGFVRSVIELVGVVVSFFAAYILSVPFGAWIYNTFLRSLLLSMTQHQVSSFTNESLSTFQQVFAQYHLDVSSLSGIAQAGADTANSVLLTSVVDPLGTLIGRGIAFFVLFLLFLMVIRMIAHVSEILNKLPVIGGLNHIGGAAVGLVKAVLVMFVLCTLVAILIPVFSVEKNPPVTNTTVNQTVFFRQFYQANPMKDILLKK